MESTRLALIFTGGHADPVLMTYFLLAPSLGNFYKPCLFMKKIIQTLVITTFAAAGVSQFTGCSEAAPVDPPEAAEEEEEESEGEEGE